MAATFVTMGSVIKASHGQDVHFVVATHLGGRDHITFAAVTAAVSNILLSFTGHIAYFTIIDEMREPKDFLKALIATNIVTVILYALAGCVIYKFVGSDVASLALDSAPDNYSKIAYGLAIPTIIVAGVIAALVACKRTYDLVWHKHPEVKRENTFRAWSSWIVIVVSKWAVAWFVANVIPWFGLLLSVIGAAVGTWICLGFPALFWLYYSWHNGWCVGRKNKALMVVHVILLVMCIAASVLGLYGSIKEIQGQSGSTRLFACSPDA